jgi:membrane-bound metal-dependent hydrolase YbcI (DUF457 family)
MLLMCHVFIGLIIGLLLFHFLKDRRVVMLAAIGGILPDLIDKPLGHIILNGSIDYGRIYAHSGLFLITILVCGIIYHQKKGTWIIMALTAGLVSHLLLDSMWELPVTVLYPFLGDFGVHHFPNYFENSIMNEIGSAYEWIFGVSASAMLLFTYRDRLGRFSEDVARFTPRIMKNVSILLMVTAFLSVLSAAMGSYNPLSRSSIIESNLMIGIAGLIGGFMSYQIWARYNAEAMTIVTLDQ